MLTIQEIILQRIEQDNLFAVSDMVDQLPFERPLIVEILNRLEERGIVYQVNRYMPGSDRPQFMYKSSRVENVEADEVIKAPQPFAYSEAASDSAQRVYRSFTANSRRAPVSRVRSVTLSR
jgi:predicted ArsR family transcriptional regulator